MILRENANQLVFRIFSTAYFMWPCSLAITSTGRVGLWLCGFYVQEHLKAQPAVVLVFNRLRRRGYGLKSHPTDWEKPGIEPATPGLQDIGLSPAQYYHSICVSADKQLYKHEKCFIKDNCKFSNGLSFILITHI